MTVHLTNSHEREYTRIGNHVSSNILQQGTYSHSYGRRKSKRNEPSQEYEETQTIQKNAHSHGCFCCWRIFRFGGSNRVHEPAQQVKSLQKHEGTDNQNNGAYISYFPHKCKAKMFLTIVQTYEQQLSGAQQQHLGGSMTSVIAADVSEVKCKPTAYI
jgi:hypothetical protein